MSKEDITMSNWMVTYKEDDMLHYGVKGMKWRFKKGPTQSTQLGMAGGAKRGAQFMDSKRALSANAGRGANRGVSGSAKPTGGAQVGVNLKNKSKKIKYPTDVHGARKIKNGWYITLSNGKAVTVTDEEFPKLPPAVQQRIKRKTQRFTTGSAVHPNGASGLAGAYSADQATRAQRRI